MSATKALLPEPGNRDGIGTTLKKWEEGHYKELRSEGLVVEQNDTSEVWIGRRGIGSGGTRLPGSGSKIDPYDGTSQADFDALMATHAVVPSRIIHIDDGGYTTNFAWGSAATAAQITGGGIGKTVLTNTTKVGRMLFGTGDNILFEGFTIDCNGQGVTTTSGVRIAGNKAKIRNVRVINASDGTTECFPICITPVVGASVLEGLIEYCEVDVFNGSSGTMISLITNDPLYAVTGTVQFCSVRDCLTNAYGAASVINAIFRENYSFRNKRAFIRDSFQSNGLTLRGNRFLECIEQGIHLNGAGTPAYNDIVDGNEVSIKPTATSYQAYYIHGHLNGVIVRNNTARFVAGAQAFCWGFAVQNVDSGLLVTGNKASTAFRNEFTMSTGNPPDLLFDNTTLEDGSAMFKNAIVTSPRMLVPFNIHVPSLARTLDILPASLFDPDVSAMRALVPPSASLSATTVTALDTLVKGLKTDEAWDKFYEVYALCGDFTVALLKLKYFGGNTSLINGGFVAGAYVETGATGGLKGDGVTNNYLDTLFNPVAAVASLSDFALGTYVDGAPVDGVSSDEMGSSSGSPLTNLTHMGWGITGSREMGEIGGTGAHPASVARTGMLIVSCDGDRDQKYYDDGALISTTESTGAFADTTIYLGALHSAFSGLPTHPMVRYLRLAFISRGLDATDVTNITNRVATFQTSLTRNV